MYESPITIILKDLQKNFEYNVETSVMEAIQKYDIKVDKEELLKALNYERNQYVKGYLDCKYEMIEMLNDLIKKIRRLEIDYGNKD